MKFLFLHGWHSVPGGLKPTYLADHGHTVINPALDTPNADWVYVRFLPTTDQIKAVHRAYKRAFIAGPTVAGNLPENWQYCADVGLDAILTDYPLELWTILRGCLRIVPRRTFWSAATRRRFGFPAGFHDFASDEQPCYTV